MGTESMKKAETPNSDTLRKEYRREGLGEGVRGKHCKQFKSAPAHVVWEQPKPLPHRKLWFIQVYPGLLLLANQAFQEQIFQLTAGIQHAYRFGK